MPGFSEIKASLKTVASKADAMFLQRYFKTAKGEYGSGDVFIGVRMPSIRKLAHRFVDIPLNLVQNLLRSRVHEERMLALIIMINKFKSLDEQGRKLIYEQYLKAIKYVNNWDLVDVSAEKILGAYLFGRNLHMLYTLASSTSLWQRRIAIMATLYFIRQRQFEPTLKLAKQLLHDREELVQKAVGWMLREVGKRDRSVEEAFLQQHYREMPRTMLRYAIEKFPSRLREKYLKGKI